MKYLGLIICLILSSCYRNGRGFSAYESGYSAEGKKYQQEYEEKLKKEQDAKKKINR